MPDTQWLADPVPDAGPVRTGTRASFLVDAEEYYVRLREVVETATAGSLICWAGFQSGTHTPMPARPGTTPGLARRVPRTDDVAWFDLLAAATARGAALRVLLNLHPEPTATYRQANLVVVEALNRLPHTAAIDDFRYLHVNGTHHQKLVVVHDGRRLTAFVATMDVCTQRIEERWCELAVELGGEAARDVYRVFYERWVEHDATLALLAPERRTLPDPAALRVRRTPGRARVRVSTTYGNPQRAHPLSRRRAVPEQQVVNAPHRVQLSRRPPLTYGNDFFTQVEPGAAALIAAAQAQAPTYWFAPHGRHAIYDELRAALARPSRTIYLEDQYLVADEPMGELPALLDLLATRVADPGFRSLVVLTTRRAEIDHSFLGLASPHRRACVQRLVEAGGAKVVVCRYRSNADLGTGLTPGGASPFYVHSKTWVFDDELLVTGSANNNRRGYSHDSELDVAVADPRAVRALRQRLWLARLNAGLTEPAVTLDDVADPVVGAAVWADPAGRGLALERHPVHRGAGARALDAPRTLGDLASERVAALYRVRPARLDRFLWDVVVDPEGT